ncbi:MAG: SRPBCC domain-containing protein [Pseudomonadota bacterium]
MTSPESNVDLVITRVFNAPRDLVFKTMTDTEHLQKWWGPKGCTIKVARHEPHAGGVFHYQMVFPGGFNMWGKFQYREITAPGRIVYINGFADAEGNTIPNPMSPVWPLDVLNTTTLLEQDGKTVLMLRSQPLNASEAERQAFLAGHPSMHQGFGGMYDQYDEYLATL